MKLTPSAVKLFNRLCEMTRAERADTTNAEFAERLRCCTRTITAGLSRLEAAHLIRVIRTTPHPEFNRTGREIEVFLDGEWR